jgi:uroporphyrinogen decarboxylase
MKNLLSVLKKEKPTATPIWLMRQAGRYLPEYRALREKAGSFMKLVLNPELAAEVTLQPVKRFGMDGTILFSDILIVPYGLGHSLEFVEGTGPVLEKITDKIPAFDQAAFEKRTANIYETVSRVKADMPTTSTLIGFCGAPFTVACYLLGNSKTGFDEALKRAAEQPEFFIKLLDVLADASIFYLQKQIDAGAEALQIFDSHSGLVKPDQFEEFILKPTRKIIAGIRAKNPELPIIAFPRGTSKENILRYDTQLGAQGLSIDTDMPMDWAQKNLNGVLQGNLDPKLMEGDEAPMLQAAENLLRTMQKPFVFNLGHGLNPQARPENVAALAKFVQDFRA